jgi:hypothetical protein
MAISNTNSNAGSFFLSPSQVNSAAANGSIQPGQMVLVPTSMFESGQVDTSQFQPIGNFDPSMYQVPDSFGQQASGSYPNYSGNGQNPFNNGLPMAPGPEIGSYPGGSIVTQQTPGSQLSGCQIQPTLPTSIGIPTSITGQGQSSSFTPYIAQIMQIMIPLLSQMMKMMPRA